MAHMRCPPLEIMVASEATATDTSVLTSISVLLGILLQGRKKLFFIFILFLFGNTAIKKTILMFCASLLRKPTYGIISWRLLSDGLLLLFFFSSVYSVLTCFFPGSRGALGNCRCPWLRLPLSAIMGQLKQTRPLRSNPKHLLTFLSCLLVLHSRSGGRWRWPELLCYNMWNMSAFHLSKTICFNILLLLLLQI